MALAPAGLEHAFLCDSGSVSVEVAVKMCLQYWRSRGARAKTRLLTWRGGYHGDTFMAMSVCDPEGACTACGTACSRGRCSRACRPPASAPEWTRRTRNSCGGLIETHKAELAAVIVEPVVQGAGGMRFHDPGYLRVLREACDAQ